MIKVKWSKKQMNLKNTIIKLFSLTGPSIIRLIQSKVIPNLKCKAYEHLDSFVDDRIEDLCNLVEKAKKTDDDIKKKAHLEGLSLGCQALNVIGVKLIEASKTILSEVNKI